MYKMYFKPFPKIKADNLLLRFNKFRDIKDIYEIYKEKEVCKYSDILVYDSIYDARYYYFNNLKKYLKKCCYSFMVEDTNINKVIGTVSITQCSYNYKIVQIGYSFNKNFHKKGYATKAVSAFIEFCFNKLETERVEALVLPENIASIKLLEKLGFKNEGLLKKGAMHNGNAKDVFMFAKYQ